MDLKIATHLYWMTSEFYARVHTSFDATRQAPWPGWERVMDIALNGMPDSAPLNVLDLACGNLRFERYLERKCGRVHTWAYDNCPDLARAGEGTRGVRFVCLDIANTLLGDKDLTRELGAPPCDLAVSFGFLHHIPLPEHRHAVMRALVDGVRVGGVVAVSLWQFAKSPRIMTKARPVAGGNEGDYLLGWQDRSDVSRYCHSFDEDEVDELAGCVSERAHEVTRYSSDGKTGDLNRYLVLRRQ